MNVEAPSQEALTTEALALVGRLHEELDGRRRELLDARQELQARLDAGETLDFVWAPQEFTVAPVPDALQDRRVEITGPTSRKMVINALNSGARGFMADFEDSNSPSWQNMTEGQVNLTDAVNGTIEHDEKDKHYELGEDPAVLHVRPRGLHLPENHLLVDGRPTLLLTKCRVLSASDDGPGFGCVAGVSIARATRPRAVPARVADVQFPQPPRDEHGWIRPR